MRVFEPRAALGPPSQLRLQPKQGKALTHTATKADGYALRFAVPSTAPMGDYTLSVHNGFGSDSTWAPVGTLAIRKSSPAKTTIFNVKDFGPKAIGAVKAALIKAEENGGGVV